VGIDREEGALMTAPQTVIQVIPPAGGEGYWEVRCPLPGGLIAIAHWDPRSPFSNPERLLVVADPDSEEYDDFGGITGDVLRAVPMKSLTRALRAEMEAVNQAPEAQLSTVNVGRAGKGRRFYAEVAEQYAEQVNLGDRSPIATIARMQSVGVETVRARVKRARALGFLEGPPGELASITQAALDVLDEAED
jgi:hypothetical protein